MDVLAITIERYEVGEEDLLYIVKAENEEAAMKINSSFELNALEVGPTQQILRLLILMRVDN